MNKDFVFIFVCIAILFFLLGCISPTSTQNKNVDLSLGKLEVLCPDANGTPCSCFVCMNGTGSSSTYTLEGGNCSFVPCNYTYFASLNGSTKVFPGVFMFGQGPTYGDFNRANKLCNNSLSMVVKWLTGTANNGPSPPSNSTARCFLRHQVIPVYVYYSGKTNMSVLAATNIAKQLKGSGPVIITTEINVNAADLNAVRNQVLAIKANCPNCLIALAPSALDNASIDALLSDPDINESVDIIGQGIFLNDINTSWVGGSCDPTITVTKHISFASKNTLKYGKPTLWYYFAASPGNTSDNKCTWTADDVKRAYYYTTTNSWIIASSGVLGVAHYSFNETILTNTKKFSLTDNDGTQRHPQINGWFEGCQLYRSAFVQSPVVFPSLNGSFRQCSFAYNLNILKFKTFEQNFESGLITSNTIQADPNNAFSC